LPDDPFGVGAGVPGLEAPPPGAEPELGATVGLDSGLELDGLWRFDCDELPAPPLELDEPPSDGIDE